MIKEFDNYSLGKMILESISGFVPHHIMYDPEEGKIIGISESLFKHFGLRLTMSYIGRTCSRYGRPTRLLFNTYAQSSWTAT